MVCYQRTGVNKLIILSSQKMITHNFVHDTIIAIYINIMRDDNKAQMNT